jgi:hypothetical protein
VPWRNLCSYNVQGNGRPGLAGRINGPIYDGSQVPDAARLLFAQSFLPTLPALQSIRYTLDATIFLLYLHAPTARPIQFF